MLLILIPCWRNGNRVSFYKYVEKLWIWVSFHVQRFEISFCPVSQLTKKKQEKIKGVFTQILSFPFYRTFHIPPESIFCVKLSEKIATYFRVHLTVILYPGV